MSGGPSVENRVYATWGDIAAPYDREPRQNQDLAPAECLKAQAASEITGRSRTLRREWWHARPACGYERSRSSTAQKDGTARWQDSVLLAGPAEWAGCEMVLRKMGVDVSGASVTFTLL